MEGESLIERSETALQVRWLGRRDYLEVWEMQRELAAQRLAGAIPDTLLLLEHPPTITLGRAARQEHLLTSPEDLARRGFALVETDRGGDITYHGPGQLVGYPILNLREPPHTPDLHAYLRRIEACLIAALARYGLAADRFAGYTGVWVERDMPRPKKIAAIGVKASRWITQHGFALNVCPELAHFEHIVPCGIHDYGVTSLARQLARPVSVEQVTPDVVAAFNACFGYSKLAS
jgi:lipoate-protein ligase B